MLNHAHDLAAQTPTVTAVSMFLPSPDVAVLAIMCTSAATMILLFWYFPVTTATLALGYFLCLGRSAHLAQVAAA